ncbi:MAG: helix-turn-helix transcriptional regulator [Candidatus Bathyarchaeota archaeon]|nr:MAG: helix-turn-helix transcriptional regulator [Candidatus Bathyarchaeota archaeon]
MRVYKFLFQRSGNCTSPRQIARELRSNVKHVAYHLNKLLDLGLVKKVNGYYHITEIIEGVPLDKLKSAASISILA